MPTLIHYAAKAVIFVLTCALIGLFVLSSLYLFPGLRSRPDDGTKTGAQAATKPPSPVRIDNVERIFVRSTSDFLLYAKSGGRLVPHRVESITEITVFLDAKPGQDAWASTRACDPNLSDYCNGDYLDSAEVHIHAAAELGGSRSGGKFPVTMSPIE